MLVFNPLHGLDFCLSIGFPCDLNKIEAREKSYYGGLYCLFMDCIVVVIVVMVVVAMMFVIFWKILSLCALGCACFVGPFHGLVLFVYWSLS
jgi:hypothetical protein